MAVYTHVPTEAVHNLLAIYDIGDVIELIGITDGVENSNYLLKTSKGQFVLTLFEKRVKSADLPFFLRLMSYLSRCDIPTPVPVADKQGAVLQKLCGKPAVIISFLPGAVKMTPRSEDCRTLGAMLARLHVAGANFPLMRTNDLSLAAWKLLAKQCSARAMKCAPSLDKLIADEITYVDKNWPTNLPAGVIHADLFPDNVFFEGSNITGVIDFYFACNDFYVYDVAVCLNSWANPSLRWSYKNASALLTGYNMVRPLSQAEIDALPIMLRGSALRFLLTRLFDWQNQIEDAHVNVKDPLEYRNILSVHRNAPPSELYEINND